MRGSNAPLTPVSPVSWASATVPDVDGHRPFLISACSHPPVPPQAPAHLSGIVFAEPMWRDIRRRLSDQICERHLRAHDPLERNHYPWLRLPYVVSFEDRKSPRKDQGVMVQVKRGFGKEDRNDPRLSAGCRRIPQRPEIPQRVPKKVSIFSRLIAGSEYIPQDGANSRNARGI